MVRISDIIGALMRGITTARIQSDIHSAAAAQAYLNDEQLRQYPVPRTEIRQADVSLKVSILDTVQKNLDTNDVALQSLLASVPGYVSSILALQAKPTQGSPDTELKPLSTYFGENLDEAVNTVATQLENYLTANIVTVWPELSANPSKFGGGAWKTQTDNALAAAKTQYQVTAYTSGSEFSKAVAAVSKDWAESEAAAGQLAVDLAITSFFDLDLAVKKDQIFSLPSHVMSEVKLTLAVENYEWTSVKDKQGNVINKLTHK
ncbi:MAG: hypothetical protein R3B70_06390 [Polyangiaceae bacterium]